MFSSQLQIKFKSVHVGARNNANTFKTCRPSRLQYRRFYVQAKTGEISYIMIKPDGIQRGLVGEIISRFEKKGFQLKGLKMVQTDKQLAETHYDHLKSKKFFPDLVDYLCSGPVICMAWAGKNVISSGRKLIGATNPIEAEPGTIRGDLAVEVGRNIVHGSDSVENGQREIGLWFNESELYEWDLTNMPWLRELDRVD
eukprot:TRINITY_DN700_c1_g1_i1.p1 TRINITY_DN700_c1_g1~~TRINITY_DN700_c1_g1_i1.p1  ORF type:complete len:198 (-),score=18.22 TRINITY_DN700_c1_g1_i1:148-741(-)